MHVYHALLGLCVLAWLPLPSPAQAQAGVATETLAPTFAAPVRIQAGEGFLGQGRLYPSPVFQDMNGDGLLDLVVGDLRGLLTKAHRIPGEGPPRFEKDVALLDDQGGPLKFDNW